VLVLFVDVLQKCKKMYEYNFFHDFLCFSTWQAGSCNWIQTKKSPDFMKKRTLRHSHHTKHCLTLWHLAAFGDFQKKKRLNARGFVREYLRSCSSYGSGRSVKRRGKSSSLHSKKIFVWGVRVFCEWHHKWRTFRPLLAHFTWPQTIIQ